MINLIGIYWKVHCFTKHVVWLFYMWFGWISVQYLCCQFLLFFSLTLDIYNLALNFVGFPYDPSPFIFIFYNTGAVNIAVYHGLEIGLRPVLLVVQLELAILVLSGDTTEVARHVIAFKAPSIE